MMEGMRAVMSACKASVRASSSRMVAGSVSDCMACCAPPPAVCRHEKAWDDGGG